MKKLREYIPPRLVMMSGIILFLSLSLSLFFATAFFEYTTLAAGEWLPELDRVKVDLTGTFRDVEGNPARLTDFQDEILLLNFWATWCPPCLLEMPSMASLHEELGIRGLRIVAITNEDLNVVRRFLQSNPYPFTVLVDTDGTLSERLGVWALPLTLILDKNGKLVYFHQGAQRWDTPDMKQQLSRLINE